jgi:hypothetical protein
MIIALAALSCCVAGVDKKVKAKELADKIARKVGSNRSGADATCDYCQYIVGYIEQLVLEGFLEEEIIALVNALCEMIPVFGDLCEQWADQEIIDIIKWIEAGYGPEWVCTELGLCGSAKKLPLRKKLRRGKGASKPSKEVLKARMERLARKFGQKGEGREKKDMFCDYCQEIVGYIEQLVLEGFAEEEIIALVNELCQTLPWPVSDYCQEYADDEIRTIIKWIEDGYGPDWVCKELGVC